MTDINIMSLPKEERLAAIKARFERSLPGDKKERMNVPNLEVRVVEGEGEDDSKHIEGYAAVWDKDSDGLWFTERVAKGAFTETIKQDDIVGLSNHNTNIVLGRNTAKTMDLKEDNTGLFYDILSPDTTQASDLHKSIKRGDIKGSSFSFITQKDEWEYLDDGNTVIRTLLKVKLYDVGPTPFPAYPDSTTGARSLEARSLEKWINEQEKEFKSSEEDWELDYMQRRLDIAERESQ